MIDVKKYKSLSCVISDCQEQWMFLHIKILTEFYRDFVEHQKRIPSLSEILLFCALIENNVRKHLVSSNSLVILNESEIFSPEITYVLSVLEDAKLCCIMTVESEKKDFENGDAAFFFSDSQCVLFDDIFLEQSKDFVNEVYGFSDIIKKIRGGYL